MIYKITIQSDIERSDTKKEETYILESDISTFSYSEGITNVHLKDGTDYRVERIQKDGSGAWKTTWSTAYERQDKIHVTNIESV